MEVLEGDMERHAVISVENQKLVMIHGGRHEVIFGEEDGKSERKYDF